MTVLGWIGVGVVAICFVTVLIICMPDKFSRK